MPFVSRLTHATKNLIHIPVKNVLYYILYMETYIIDRGPGRSAQKGLQEATYVA